MKKTGLDATDLRILSAVQKHGKLSKTKLAELVNLSPTPCLARLDRLTAEGYITGYRAEIALDRIGEFTQVIVSVELAHHHKSDFDRFEARIKSLDEVTECIATGGGMDYIMKIVSPSLSAFQALMDSLVEGDVGIERYRVYITMRRVKSEPPNLWKLAAKSGS